MKIARFLCLALFCLPLASCMPLYGQLMRLAEGLKRYEVVSGELTDLKRGSTLLVVGPFLGAGDEHHMCIPRENCLFPYNAEILFVSKYNDAQRFAQGFQTAGLFNTELYLEVYYDDLPKTTERLRAMSPAEIQAAFHLKKAPDLVLFGLVVSRIHKIAPMRGMEVGVHYILEFFNPETHKSVQVDTEVFDLFQNDLKRIIGETSRRLDGGKGGRPPA